MSCLSTTCYYNTSGLSTANKLTMKILSTTTAASTSLLDVNAFRLMKCYVNPSVSVVSLILNVMSAVVFVKSGIRKPANIFLCGLSIADLMSQCYTLSFANILRYFDDAKPFPSLMAWQYRYQLSYFMYVCEKIWDFVGSWGMYVQTTIPVIITADRILAVFWPLNFRRWVTFKTSLLIVLFAFIIWLPWVMFSLFIFDFWFMEIKGYYFALKAESQFFVNNQNLILIFNNYVMEVFSSWVPVALVLFGNVAIGLKVKWTLRKRRLLTSSTEPKQWSTRTTRALVSICLFFSLSHFIYTVTVYCFKHEFDNATLNVNLISEYLKLILSINKACNFLVFVMFNDKFRKRLIQMCRRN